MITPRPSSVRFGFLLLRSISNSGCVIDVLLKLYSYDPAGSVSSTAQIKVFILSSGYHVQRLKCQTQKNCSIHLLWEYLHWYDPTADVPCPAWSISDTARKSQEHLFPSLYSRKYEYERKRKKRKADTKSHTNPNAKKAKWTCIPYIQGRGEVIKKTL